MQVATQQLIDTTCLGEQVVPGLARPVLMFVADRMRPTAPSVPAAVLDRSAGAGPLTEREREVVALIVRGCTNREIAEELVIAEGTAVRHVANILNKLNLKSRAQVAVWAVERTRTVV
jgi:DNA-binding NarL/FixJ family response regulator